MVHGAGLMCGASRASRPSPSRTPMSLALPAMAARRSHAACPQRAWPPHIVARPSAAAACAMPFIILISPPEPLFPLLFHIPTTDTRLFPLSTRFTRSTKPSTFGIIATIPSLWCLNLVAHPVNELDPFVTAVSSHPSWVVEVPLGHLLSAAVQVSARAGKPVFACQLTQYTSACGHHDPQP